MSLYKLFAHDDNGGGGKDEDKDKDNGKDKKRRTRKRALCASSDDDEEGLQELECQEVVSPGWCEDTEEKHIVPLSQPREDLPHVSQEVEDVAGAIEVDHTLAHARHIPPLSVFRINTAFWMDDGDLEAHRDEAVRTCLICAHCGIVWWACEGGWDGGGLEINTRQIPYYNTDWVDMKWYCSAHVSPDCVYLADTFVNPWLCVMTHD